MYDEVIQQINTLPDQNLLQCTFHFVQYPHTIQLLFKTSDNSVWTDLKLDIRDADVVEATRTHTFISFHETNRVVIVHNHSPHCENHQFPVVPVYAKTILETIIRNRLSPEHKASPIFDFSFQNTIIHTFSIPSQPTFYQYSFKLASNIEPLDQYTVDEFCNLFELVCSHKVRFYDDSKGVINFKRKLILAIVDSQSPILMQHIKYFQEELVLEEDRTLLSEALPQAPESHPHDDLPPYF